VVVGILLPRKNIKGAIGPKILVSAFSPQPSAFILRALAVPAFFPNSHLPSAICHLPMNIVFDKIWRQADSKNRRKL